MKTLVIGAAMFEMLMKLEALPKTGEDVLCSESGIIIGGCAYNVASTLRNMGCAHDLCVPIGKGPYSEIVAAELERCGYDILIRDDSQDNGWCLDLVEAGGERTFITSQGIEGTFRRKWFDSMDLDPYDKIYVAGYQVCNESGKEMSQWLSGLSNKQIFFAPGPVIGQIAPEVKERIYSLHPVLHLNEKEALEETKAEDIQEAIQILYGRTKNLVIVTLGAEGTAYYDGEAMYKVPSEAADVVDTIGAGDSHVGALIGGLSKGYELDRAIRFANRVAANIVGVQGPVMTKEQFDEKMGGCHE